MNPFIQIQKATPVLFAALLLACFGLLPPAHAVVPAPDGGYAGFNTAEGQKALFSLTTGTGNAAVGWGSLYSDAEGSLNTAIGTGALLLNTGDQNTATGAGALLFNNSGIDNTANGAFALHLNTTGFGNTATGFSALFSNTTGNLNTASGEAALFSNTFGNWNTAIGQGALYSNTTGDSNTANGYQALYSNTTGDSNTANGDSALYNNNGGIQNTANGAAALYSNTSGDYNTASGTAALIGNTTGYWNTAIGMSALGSNTTGVANTANGFRALYSNTTGNSNTANGYQALLSNATGNSNIALGQNAGSEITGDLNINIGNPGVAGESRTVRIGTGDGVHTRMFFAGVRGVTTGQANAIPVFIDGLGQVGTVSSSRRFKKDIKFMDKASEAILALKPVTFHYKTDKAGIPQFGLIAEEVANANPDLVVRDENGDIYTVRYDAVNAMLLNEFLKEHHKVEELEANFAWQQKQIEALTAGLQKMSAQLEASQPAKQVALKDR